MVNAQLIVVYSHIPARNDRARRCANAQSGKNRGRHSASCVQNVQSGKNRDRHLASYAPSGKIHHRHHDENNKDRVELATLQSLQLIEVWRTGRRNV